MGLANNHGHGSPPLGRQERGTRAPAGRIPSPASSRRGLQPRILVLHLARADDETWREWTWEKSEAMAAPSAQAIVQLQDAVVGVELVAPAETYFAAERLGEHLLKVHNPATDDAHTAETNRLQNRFLHFAKRDLGLERERLLDTRPDAAV